MTFHIVAKNPNPNLGCLCERHGELGPYCLFDGDMLDVAAPRPVLCAQCVPKIQALLDGKPVKTPDPIELPATEFFEIVEDDEIEGL